MNQLPMFLSPDDHCAFVRVVELPWPMVGVGYAVVCPGCPAIDSSLWEDYEGAYRVALAHRSDQDAWIPAEELPFGPRHRWGSRP